MTKPTGKRLNIFSDTPLTEEGGFRIDSGGVAYYHDGAVEQILTTGGGGGGGNSGDVVCEEFTATGGQAIFTTSAGLSTTNKDNLHVAVDGFYQEGSSWTLSNTGPVEVTFGAGLTAGQNVTICQIGGVAPLPPNPGERNVFTAAGGAENLAFTFEATSEDQIQVYFDGILRDEEAGANFTFNAGSPSASIDVNLVAGTRVIVDRRGGPEGAAGPTGATGATGAPGSAFTAIQKISSSRSSPGGTGVQVIPHTLGVEPSNLSFKSESGTSNSSSWSTVYHIVGGATITDLTMQDYGNPDHIEIYTGTEDRVLSLRAAGHTADFYAVLTSITNTDITLNWATSNPGSLPATALNFTIMLGA